MADPLTRTLGAPTPQTQPRPGHNQVQNNAGGYVYEVDLWQRLDRFLILGTEGGTYYAAERELTLENLGAVDAALAADPKRAITRTVEVSQQALAPRNNQAIYVLARAATGTNQEARNLAHDALLQVCRTTTHLYQFAGYVKLLRGGKFSSGRGLRSALRRYYLQDNLDRLALHAVKYRQREGWTHRDLLRLAHPVTTDPARRDLFRFMVSGEVGGAAPAMVKAFKTVNTPGISEMGARVAVMEHGLPWEAVPDAMRTPGMWRALLPAMPVGATIRQLATMTRKGVLGPLSEAEDLVVSRLTNPEQVRASKVHPVQVLDALLTYDSNGIPNRKVYSTWGSGMDRRGKSQGEPYTPNQAVVKALNETFRLAFKNVEPAGKRTYIGVDVSGSMGALCTNVMTCTEAAAALALVIAATEPKTYVMGFNNGVENLGIHGAMTIAEATHAARAINTGGTDCALPMVDALAKGIEVDTFCVITDSETWAGKMQPAEALEKYRRETGIPARLVVLGLTATRFSIANPNDPGMLDVAGFSADVPQLLQRFSAGAF